MAKVHTSTTREFHASPDAVLGVLRDYQTQRPRMLPDAFTDYQAVREGEKTVVRYRLHATKTRVRSIDAVVEESSGTLREQDRNSTMLTTWRVTPASQGARVTVDVEWQGAGGIGGVFEGIFAPRAMKGFLDQALERLAPLVKTA